MTTDFAVTVPTLPQTLSVDEAAKYSGIHSEPIRDAIAAGKLKVIRIGRTLRIPRVMLDKFIVEAAEGNVDLADCQEIRRAAWPSHQKITRSRRSRA